MKIEYTPERGQGFVRPGETEKQQNWGFSGIKKAAPIWSRLSEQITRCALCVCDPKHKHGDDSRYQAGGQCYQSGSVRCHTCNGRVSLYSLRNCSRAKAHGANLSDSCSIFLRRLFRAGDGVLVDSLLVMALPCKTMHRSSSHHGAGDGYSCSLAFRRCSYFNLRPQASKTHAEKLALGLVNFSCSTLASIPSISSCGNRIFFFADLLFVFPLDIGTPHLNGFDGRTQYSKKSEKLSIDMCAHMILICAHSLGCIAQIKQRPAVLATHAGRLTTNDSESIEVAMLNHTTHPQGRDSHNLNKYIWRFIALSTAQPRVITIEATSEQEARQKNQLIATGGNGYDSRAPHKTGAGITTPLEIKAIQTPHASFFVSAHTHTFTMVGCTGPTSVGLVSFIASCGNSVQSTASELTTSGGGVIPTIKEAANMATIPTLVHSQTAFIWRFIIFGASESQ
ncbi:TPA: ash family protein, partial [Escherichia coli]|nr:ash family protein [Escherichia coli]